MASDPAPEPARHRGGGRGGLQGPQARQRALPRLGGRHLRREVVDLATTSAASTYATDRFRAVAGDDDWPVRARAGAGQRHRLLPAEPHAGRRDQEGLGHRPVARHGRGRRCATPSTSASTSTAGSPTPSASRTTTTRSTSSSGTRCCTTSRTWRRRCARCCGCSSRAAGSCSRASRRTIGDFYARKLGQLTWWLTTNVTKACRCCGAGGGRRTSSTSRRGRRRWRRSSTCTRSTRIELEATARAAGACRRPRDDRGAVRGAVRLAGAHVRGRRAAREAGLRVGDVRLPRLAAAVLAGRERALEGRCRASCSTTC